MTSDLTKIVEDSARGSFNLVVGALISSVTYSISALLIARFLGPENYGFYALSIVIPQMLYYFTDFGLSSGLMKFLADLRKKGHFSTVAKIIKYSMILRFITGLTLFLINFALADFFATFVFQRPELGFFIKIGSLSILFQAIFNTVTSTYIGLDKTEYSAFSTYIEAISKALISITLVVSGFGVVGAIIGHVTGYLIGAISGLVFLIPIVKKLSKKNKVDIAFSGSFRTLLHYGLPLYLSIILIGFLPPFETFILAIFTSSITVGNFKAGVNFIILLNIITLQITHALLPAFSKMNSNKKSGLTQFFKFANKYIALLILPFIILLIFFSEEIVNLVYGGTYLDAAMFLSLYSTTYFLVGFGYLSLDSLFNGLGKTRITLAKSIIVFLIILILSPFATNIFGVLGLIVVIIFAKLVGTIYGIISAKRHFKIGFYIKPICLIYFIGFISTFPLFLLRITELQGIIQLIVGSLLFLFCYITLLPLANVVSNSELLTLKEILSKIKPLKLIITPLILYQSKILKIKEFNLPDNKRKMK